MVEWLSGVRINRGWYRLMGQWVHAGYCGDGWVVHWYGGDGCKPGSGITIDGVVVGCEVVIGGVSSSG